MNSFVDGVIQSIIGYWFFKVCLNILVGFSLNMGISEFHTILAALTFSGLFIFEIVRNLKKPTEPKKED